MKTAVCVAAYKRPEYFTQCLASLEKNPESQTLPFFFYLDGGHGSMVRSNMDLIEKTNIKEKHIIARGEWYGLGRNLIDVRRQTFETHGFDQMIFFEEDMIITPQYIRLLLNLRDWGLKRNIATVQASPVCVLSKEDKEKRLTEVRNGTEIFSGYLMDRDCWLRIRDVLYEYESSFLMDRPYRNRPHVAILKWMAKKLGERTEPEPDADFLPVGKLPCPFRPGRPWPTSQDGVTAMAMWRAGYDGRLTTVINRAHHIGEWGEHVRPHNYKQNKFDQMVLDEFESDAELKSFVWAG